jgi:flagellar motor switch protein FliM
MVLPFDLPSLSPALVEATRSVRAAGREAAVAAARALSALLEREVEISTRVLPVSPGREAGACVAIELGTVAASARLEVDAALVVRMVDVLAGGEGEVTAATALTPVETSALELFALTALDGVRSIASVEAALAPRISRAGPVGSPSLAVEIDVRVGAVHGRARLVVPAAALRALRAACGETVAAGPLSIPASLRRGLALLDPEELDALEPGDVVRIDPPPDGRDVVAFPGVLRAAGTAEEGSFHVEEIVMTERHAQVPIPIEVEIARFEVPLLELARLEEGTVIPLPIDRRGLVALRCGERIIARGELVDLDGAVGVRILSVEVAG